MSLSLGEASQLVHLAAVSRVPSASGHVRSNPEVPRKFEESEIRPASQQNNGARQRNSASSSRPAKRPHYGIAAKIADPLLKTGRYSIRDVAAEVHKQMAGAKSEHEALRLVRDRVKFHRSKGHAITYSPNGLVLIGGI